MFKDFTQAIRARWARAMSESRRITGDDMGQAGVIAVVVGIVLFVAVALPVTLDVIANSSATGTTLTILNILPVMLAVGALLLVVSLFRMR